MISRNNLKGDILKIYKDERTKYYNLLGKIKCRIAITTDMWTSSNNKGFIAVTGHFINDNWTLQNCILRFLYVPAPHTTEVLADTLVESLMDWNIDRKVSTITVDNCTTNDAMINHPLQKLPTKDMLLDGKVLHMRCCAHILNLIVKDGLDIIGSSIERIRDSVIYWTASPSRVEKFEETARQVPVNCTKKLCLDCKTRWNSTYLMLETAIIYKDVFPRLNVREKNYKSLPTEEDWLNAIEICGKLKLFHQMSLVEFFFRKIYHESARFKIDEVRQNCYDLLFDYQSRCCTLNESSSSIGSLENTMSSDVHSDVNVDDSLDEFEQFVVSKTSGATNLSATSELDMYLEESLLPRARDFDILNWWKTNGVKFPTLQKMARDILAIPVSTVASESAFSSSGKLINPHRNRLHHILWRH
ncbi:UNVERIFIED_CONTAM: Zinc finger BED domain-containing protein RICESLEEPER 2 [Sesamum radiatum]|uniref:Zinc finger BED domain-containing protein RICESLEEPER 2 n=1 Tax=Sesamum radiatum TaxID=300843 RepID=A0AAW2S4I0_SESRA